VIKLDFLTYAFKNGFRARITVTIMENNYYCKMTITATQNTVLTTTADEWEVVSEAKLSGGHLVQRDMSR